MIWIDPVLAKVHDTPLPVRDFCGGFLCDEPGLGKTITILSLLLRTKGTQSQDQCHGSKHVHHGHDPMTLAATILRSPIRQDPSITPCDGRRQSTRATRHDPHHHLLALCPSRTTLVIVPDTLLAHWQYQMSCHTSGLDVYFDQYPPLPLRKNRRYHSSKDVPNHHDNNHNSSSSSSNNISGLPPPASLARYDVVVTTFGRLVSQWQWHRPLHPWELRRRQDQGRRSRQEAQDEQDPNDYDDEEDLSWQRRRTLSPLLRIHWVRLIVDEGHKLGSITLTNGLQMLCALTADKRWIMTGTPTPNIAACDGLRHLHGLLRFLHDRPYGAHDDKAWRCAIAKPFESHMVDGYIRLQTLLNRIMLRHVKAEVASIPEPVRTWVVVEPTPLEFRIYNGVVGAIRGNLVVRIVDLIILLFDSTFLLRIRRKTKQNIDISRYIVHVCHCLIVCNRYEKCRLLHCLHVRTMRMERKRLALVLMCATNSKY